MNDYRYILDKSSKKFNCPNCGKRSFVRYIDTHTYEYLPEIYGRCDREQNCRYFLDPYKDGYSKEIWERGQSNLTAPIKRISIVNKQLPEITPAYIPTEILNQTSQPERNKENVFINNLLNNVPFVFNKADIERIINLYKVGTVIQGNRKGAVTFPFIDIKNNIRAIQVKQFDKNNHTTGTDFLHSITEKYYNSIHAPLPEWLQKYNEYKSCNTIISCLFGEHLLSQYPNNPIALVEAPKTAIYGTLYFGFPENANNFLWLAVYNKSSFKLEKIKVLQGKRIVIFPDLGAFDDWKIKAKDIERQLTETKFVFSDILERFSSEVDRKNGLDLADYLIKNDWRDYRN